MSILQFMQTYNFNRPEKEILCDLIYISNQYKLTPSVVEFGEVMELDQRPDIEDDPNSYIEAEVNPSFDFRMKPGETGFLYHRLPLSGLRTVEDTVIIPPALPFTTYDILDQINRQLGIELTEDDLVDVQYTSLDGDFVITAKPGSKVWIGSKTINVQGGGNKLLLFPNGQLFGIVTATDLTADVRTQLNQIANHDNAVAWTSPTDFEFGANESTTVDSAGRNTRIYVTAHKPGYIDQWLYYVRINPPTINDQFIDGVVPEVTIPNAPFTIVGIIAQINSTLNLHLTTEDVEDTPYQPGNTTYQIKFKPTSIGWLPGVYTIKVNYDQEQVANPRLVSTGGNNRTSDGTTVRVYA